MTPIPLTAPDGTVYSYACGSCHHIGGSGVMLVAHDAEAIARCAESSRLDAERCCRCTLCGIPNDRGRHLLSLSFWPRYCTACAVTMQARQAARVAANRAAMELEAASEQGGMDARDRAITEAFFAGTSIYSLALDYVLSESDIAVAIRGWAREVLDV